MQSDELAELAEDAGMEDLPTRRRPAGRRAARRRTRKARAGGEVELVLDTSEIKLFDPDGGRSLTYAETNGAGRARARRPRAPHPPPRP